MKQRDTRFWATIKDWERLESTNRQLLEALEWFANRFHTNTEVAKSWGDSCSMPSAEWEDWEIRARTAILLAKETS